MCLECRLKLSFKRNLWRLSKKYKQQMRKTYWEKAQALKEDKQIINCENCECGHYFLWACCFCILEWGLSQHPIFTTLLLWAKEIMLQILLLCLLKRKWFHQSNLSMYYLSIIFLFCIVSFSANESHLTKRVTPLRLLRLHFKWVWNNLQFYHTDHIERCQERCPVSVF